MKLTQEVIDQIQEAMLHTKRNGDVTGKMVMRLMSVLQALLQQIDLLSFITGQRVAHQNIIL